MPDPLPTSLLLLRKASPRAKLLVIKTDRSVPSFRPDFPACVCRTPCSLQHPKIGLFQRGHLRQLSSWAEEAQTARLGLSPRAGPHTDVTTRKPEGGGRPSGSPLSSLKNVSTKAGLPCPVPQQGLTSLRRATRYLSCLRNTRLPTEPKASTDRQHITPLTAVSTNSHSSFLRELGVLLLPGPSTTPRLHALPPEFPWQAGKVALSKQHTISDVIWTPLPLRGGSLSLCTSAGLRLTVRAGTPCE